jgi:hypothetical protein
MSLALLGRGVQGQARLDLGPVERSGLLSRLPSALAVGARFPQRVVRVTATNIVADPEDRNNPALSVFHKSTLASFEDRGICLLLYLLSLLFFPPREIGSRRRGARGTFAFSLGLGELEPQAIERS